MRKISALTVFLISLLALNNSSSAQEKFDIVTFKTPKGWQKELKPTAIQFATHNEANGAFGVIMLFKSVTTTNNSIKTFDISWDSFVNRNFTLTGKLEKQPSAIENGWTIESGVAPYEQDGTKGMAMLVSAVGGGRVMNLLVMTNTQDYQADVSAFIGSINLPDLESGKTSLLPQKSALYSDFKFTMTNFDNGWTASEEPNWVRVTKENITVLLHYPHPKEKETFDNLEREARIFWDLLIAPRYKNLTDFEVLRSDRDYEPARFAAGNVIDNAFGKKYFVALFSKQGRGWIEVIAPDKAAFAREFGAININDEIINWKPLLDLFNYNKFAVGAADLSGKWTTNFAGTTQYVSIYTGRYVGANTMVSAESFDFGGGNSYRWRIDAANSAGGRTNFARAQSAGKFSLPSNWEIRFSDIEGRPQIFPAHFSCIKGARVLWINGNAYGRVS